MYISTLSRQRLHRGLPVIVIAGAILALPFGSSLHAATLWYNGDYNLSDAATNENTPYNVGGSVSFNTSLVFNDFTVPSGKTWSLTSVYSNNQLAFAVTPPSATWQIRSAMSAGNGGTLVASGDTTATVTQLHAVDYNNYIDPEMTVSATVPNVVLTAGTYWVAVAPDTGGYYGDQSYIETTSGANAVGTPPGNDGKTYLFNNLTGPANFNYVASSLDYSEGVVGLAPEPGGALPIIGLAGVVCFASGRDRWRLRSASAAGSTSDPVDLNPVSI